MRMPSWSIALSGGGHRATLFGLGALLYCADAGVNRDVTSIASVSGGSIANAYVGTNVDYPAATGEEFEVAMKPLARRCAMQGTVQWAWEVVLLLVGIAAATCLAVAAFCLALSGWLQVLLCSVCVVVALGLTQARSWVADRVLRRLLFRRDGRDLHLGDLSASITHVMCATEVQSRLHAYFSRTFVYGSDYGVTTTAQGLQLSTAVQASACLPGAFSPRTLSAHKLGLPKARKHPWLWLVDGGVYDNMGDQWARGFASRAGDKLRAATGIGPAPENLMVVNASARGDWLAASPLMRVPVFGELVTLLREKSILYQVGTATRRTSLIDQFDAVRALREQPQTPDRDAVLAELGPGGTLLHIATSPAWTARPTTVDPRFHSACARVAAKVAAFGDDEWVAGLAKRSSAVKTTLAKLGPADSVGLLWHGYVLAMSNMHVFFDAPLLDVPSKARFESLIA
jgi:Patatin-like phospholipase